MQTFRGGSALTDFQERSLLARLKKIDPGINRVSAEYVHLVDSPKLMMPQEEQLKALLSYGEPFSGKRSGSTIIVIPRPGTISPWSSKATDIARNSGLDKVKRIERAEAYYVHGLKSKHRSEVVSLLYDRMTQSVLTSLDSAKILFKQHLPQSYQEIDVLNGGKDELLKADRALGLALAAEEIDYLVDTYAELGRNPTDVELMMFGVVNSEHCRHKIFNADWVIDGEAQPKSLFKMIKNTYERSGDDVLSAYHDNAAVLAGAVSDRYFPDPGSNIYRKHTETMPIVIKVETHNHPTAIAPFPGAATGAGGEIRDESATGRGARSKMGMNGFTVSNLNLPGAKRPWEKPYGKPSRIVSPLEIIVDGPLGGAAYANEFGRVNLAGYFRTYEQKFGDQIWGYHKPLMIAGGVGNIREQHIKKKKLKAGDKLIMLGGPAMLIGLGGGSASSMQTGTSEEDLDFASVQRANAEIQRRAQEVINACWALGAKNPIASIHDVGAGGLSNAFPELVHDAGLGARFKLRDIPNAEPGLSPMGIWCSEAQERYVIGIKASDVAAFEKLCMRERCPFAVVGETTQNEQLIVADVKFKNKPVDIPMELLFGKPPKMTRTVARESKGLPGLDVKDISINEAVERVLQLPAVASKKFLITIGDRSVGGLTVRDQMVGPWQVPVADVAVTASSFESKTGEALSLGERSPLALIDSPASARMAIGEAVTNIAAASIKRLRDVKLSANWMAAAGFGQEDEKLYDTVKAVGEDFCPALGLTIPVGKDSLSMRTVWEDKGKQKSVTSPLSLIITAFAPVNDVERTLTPQLAADEETRLIFVDLGQGKNRLGGSALAQVYNQVGNESPDVDHTLLKHFFTTTQKLNKEGKLLSYHDRSDGGLLATLVEMAFASRCGLDIDLSKLPGDNLSKLFNEELGVVVQVRKQDVASVRKLFGKYTYDIGAPTKSQQINFKAIYKNSRTELEKFWADTSYRIQTLRDNAKLAKQELELIADDKDPGLTPTIVFKTSTEQYAKRPRVAIFREQGVNGQTEMAYAFDKAGFTAVDVHLNDLMSGTASLDDFVGLAACGGFSYGDVLGAGEGWAKSILFNKKLRTQFKEFFERPDTFSLGVCNGCQMLSALKEIIPGAESWPRFLQNESARFEARLVSVQVNATPSIFFKGMEGSMIPIPVAHGEGRAVFGGNTDKDLVALQYVDNYGKTTTKYPFNPNGSAKGMTGFTTPDGRATIMMPHPERAFLTNQLSWHPKDWGKNGPWLKMFQNARDWVK